MRFILIILQPLLWNDNRPNKGLMLNPRAAVARALIQAELMASFGHCRPYLSGFAPCN